MFTGIVEEIGKVTSISKGTKSARLTISADLILEDLKIGDSVAVNGICLTVVELKGKKFIADAMNETLRRSTLGGMQIGNKVNLERALAAQGRFGGHIVSGHIDGIGTIIKMKKDDIAVWYTIAVSPKLMHYIIEKGSVAVDGISLTVAATDESHFEISVIPHTREATILCEKHIGSRVNVENDLVGKYIEKFLPLQTAISREFLAENGF